MKIIRRNRKEKDCGVVAAFNAASWCDSYKPYSVIEKYARSCGYNPEKGIYSFQFAALMKKLGLPCKKVKPKSIIEVEKKLYLGKFFVLLYRPTGYDLGHAIVVFTNHKGQIIVINPDSERITWNEMAADIHANGMKEFHVYEIPHRQTARTMATKNDDSRSA